MKLYNVFEVDQIKAKTTSRLLKDVQLGDFLEISIELANTGQASRGAYVPTVRVKLARTGETSIFSLNELSKILHRAFVLA